MLGNSWPLPDFIRPQTSGILPDPKNCPLQESPLSGPVSPPSFSSDPLERDPIQVRAELVVPLALGRLYCWHLPGRGLSVGLPWPPQCPPHPTCSKLFSCPYWRLSACHMTETMFSVLFCFAFWPILNSLRANTAFFICSCPVALSTVPTPKQGIVWE